MKTSEALSKLNQQIIMSSATDQQKEVMLNTLKDLILSLIKRDADE